MGDCKLMNMIIMRDQYDDTIMHNNCTNGTLAIYMIMLLLFLALFLIITLQYHYGILYYIRNSNNYHDGQLRSQYCNASIVLDISHLEWEILVQRVRYNQEPPVPFGYDF